MQLESTSIPDVLIIKPDLFRDDRGYFMESFHSEKFKQLGIETRFLQDNESLSQKGVLRGLHFQRLPWAQGKLVRVIQGSVLRKVGYHHAFRRKQMDVLDTRRIRSRIRDPGRSYYFFLQMH